MPTTPDWITRWLSTARFSAYLAAADSDPVLALDLYEWNTEISSAVLHDLSHLEVGLRNAYSESFEAHGTFIQHWTLCGTEIFAPVHRAKKRIDKTTGTQIKVQVDVNEKPRRSLNRAVSEAGGHRAPSGKVVAQLMFGFWRYLSSAAHEVPLWRPYLHHAFAPGTPRTFVDTRIGALHNLRNRVAHHEPILVENLALKHTYMLELADAIAPKLKQHITSTSRIPALLADRPTP